MQRTNFTLYCVFVTKIKTGFFLPYIIIIIISIITHLSLPQFMACSHRVYTQQTHAWQGGPSNTGYPVRSYTSLTKRRWQIPLQFGRWSQGSAEHSQKTSPHCTRTSEKDAWCWSTITLKSQDLVYVRSDAKRVDLSPKLQAPWRDPWVVSACRGPDLCEIQGVKCGILKAVTHQRAFFARLSQTKIYFFKLSTQVDSSVQSSKMSAGKKTRWQRHFQKRMSKHPVDT